MSSIPTDPTPAQEAPPKPVTRRLWRCKCGQPVFFRNSWCVACNTPLGYVPERSALYALRPSKRGGWRISAGGPAGRLRYFRCANLESPAGCNWLIPAPADGSAPALCAACRLNRTIPDLTIPENSGRWQKIEAAKRRLISSLIRLGLPVASRVGEDPYQGLAFDFLTPVPGAPPIMTGHQDGIITLNTEEAEDSKREEQRERLHEQYRTILGHLRHESGHYYWDRLIAGNPGLLQQFRDAFGDERPDYGAALSNYYQTGPPPDWQLRYVSSYATAHPWEDWAETWAHYLHMVDTLDTAASFRLGVNDRALEAQLFEPDVLDFSEPPEVPPFQPLLARWFQLTPVLNELSLSMGRPDFYPFVLSSGAVQKLATVHKIIYSGRM